MNCEGHVTKYHSPKRYIVELSAPNVDSPVYRTKSYPRKADATDEANDAAYALDWVIDRFVGQ